jgi:hypothetical protein
MKDSQLVSSRGRLKKTIGNSHTIKKDLKFNGMSPAVIYDKIWYGLISSIKLILSSGKWRWSGGTITCSMSLRVTREDTKIMCFSLHLKKN